jgi:hypothetical protein
MRTSLLLWVVCRLDFRLFSRCIELTPLGLYELHVEYSKFGAFVPIHNQLRSEANISVKPMGDGRATMARFADLQ